MFFAKHLYAFIPKHVNNAVLVLCWDLLRGRRLFPGRGASLRLTRNEEAFQRHLDSIRLSNGYVEDQNDYTDMSCGKTTMQYAGCQIFATYNALARLTDSSSLCLPALIAAYEKNGMILSGRLGVSPRAVRDYLDRKGFRTEFTTDERQFDAVSKRHPVLILTLFNDRDDIRRQAHAVCISAEDGQYYAHNLSCDGRATGPCASLGELLSGINGGRAKGISLIGISASDAIL